MSRRVLLIELIVVVLVTLGTSVGSAVISLVSEVVGINAVSNPFVVTMAGHDVLSVALATAYLCIRTAGVVALAVYVLHRSSESLRTIGLSSSKVARDLLLVIPFAVVAIRLQAIGFQLPHPSQSVGLVTSRPVIPAVYAVTGVVRSLEAALVEETIVLGFVLTRLRQLGVHPVLAILISSALRASYHLEYGLAAAGPLLFGVGLATLYLLTRRLLPAIIVHTGYDVWAIFNNFTFV